MAQHDVRMTPDFGFTFENEKDNDTTQAQELYDIQVSFLNRLKGDVDKDTIAWPGQQRHQQIENFIEKLNAIMKGNK